MYSDPYLLNLNVMWISESSPLEEIGYFSESGILEAYFGSHVDPRIVREA